MNGIIKFNFLIFISLVFIFIISINDISGIPDGNSSECPCCGFVPDVSKSYTIIKTCPVWQEERTEYLMENGDLVAMYFLQMSSEIYAEFHIKNYGSDYWHLADPSPMFEFYCDTGELREPNSYPYCGSYQGRGIVSDGSQVTFYLANVVTEDCTNGIDDDGDGLIDYDDPDCCEGVVPGLSNHETNNLYSRGSVIEAINAIIQGGLIGRYIDVDITAWISNDNCCEKVEGNFTAPSSLQPELGAIELFRVASGVHNREIAFQGANFILNVLSMFIQGTDITGAYIDTEPPVVLDGFIITNKTGDKNYAAVYETLPTYRDALLPVQNMLSMVVASPVDILITDPQGRRVGALYQDGIFIGEVNEISNIAAYTGRGSEPEFIAITDPLEGYYSVEIFGAESGTYDMNITRVINGMPTSKDEYANVGIAQNEIQYYDVLVDDTPPEVNITSPEDGSTVSLTVIINATASDGISPPAVVTSVFIDGQEVATTVPYSWDTTQYATGEHTIMVEAVDHVGNVGSDSITVMVERATVESPHSLKNDAINELEKAKIGDEKTDEEIDKIIKNIQKSLADKKERVLWIDDWHIVVKHGKKVFHEEHTAVKRMQKEIKKKKVSDDLKGVYIKVIGKLVPVQ